MQCDVPTPSTSHEQAQIGVKNETEHNANEPAFCQLDQKNLYQKSGSAQTSTQNLLAQSTNRLLRHSNGQEFREPVGCESEKGLGQLDDIKGLTQSGNPTSLYQLNDPKSLAQSIGPQSQRLRPIGTNNSSWTSEFNDTVFHTKGTNYQEHHHQEGRYGIGQAERDGIYSGERDGVRHTGRDSICSEHNRKRLEFFKRMRYATNEVTRLPSVTPFGRESADAINPLFTSHSASDISSAKSRQSGNSPHVVKSPLRYGSGAFSAVSSQCEISSTVVEPSYSNDSLGVETPDLFKAKPIDNNGTGNSNSNGNGNGNNDNDAEVFEASTSSAAPFEPVPSLPIMDAPSCEVANAADSAKEKCTQQSIRFDLNITAVSSAAKDARVGEPRETRLYVKRENPTLTYASTTGYVRSMHSQCEGVARPAFASRYANLYSSNSITAGGGNKHSASFSHGSSAADAAPPPAEFAAERITLVASRASCQDAIPCTEKTVIYSPSTSFSCAYAISDYGLGGDEHASPYRWADGQPMDLEDVLLLQQPILPPNSHFFCCFYKFHITAVAKVLSVIYALFYGLLCVLSYKSQHAAAFLIAVLVCFSVGASTLYATFKWSKMCLIPFFLLQAMLVVYALVCVALITYAYISSPESYTFSEFQRHLGGVLQLSAKSWVLLILVGLIVLTLLFCYSALLFWYEYQFIAEIDRFLKSIRRSSSQASRDDAQIQNFANGASSINFNSKSAF